MCACVHARFYVVFCCKHLHIESVLCLSMYPCVCVCVCVCLCVFTNMLAFTSLPQVGDNRMTAVKRAEDSRGWDSVMDNDSQQACGRAQPQALDCSPGEAGEMPARKTPHSSGWRGNKELTKMYGKNKVTQIPCVCACVCACVCVRVFVCVCVCMGACVWCLHAPSVGDSSCVHGQ